MNPGLLNCNLRSKQQQRISWTWRSNTEPAGAKPQTPAVYRAVTLRRPFGGSILYERFFCMLPCWKCISRASGISSSACHQSPAKQSNHRSSYTLLNSRSRHFFPAWQHHREMSPANTCRDGTVDQRPAATRAPRGSYSKLRPAADNRSLRLQHRFACNTNIIAKRIVAWRSDLFNASSDKVALKMLRHLGPVLAPAAFSRITLFSNNGPFCKGLLIKWILLPKHFSDLTHRSSRAT